MTSTQHGKNALLNDPRALAERLGAQLLDLEVAEAIGMTPTLRAITFVGDQLETFSWAPGQDLMITVGTREASLIRRRYTIRRHDPVARTLTVEVVLHGDGPGSHWAASCAQGDRVQAIGPRGQITPRAGASAHVFIGDDSFVPAASAMAEAVADETVIGIFSVDDEAAIRPTWPEDTTHWGVEPDRAAHKLFDIVKRSSLPLGSHVYIGGERSLVSDARAAVIGGGVPDDAVSAKAYWRADRANADHGEPGKE